MPRRKERERARHRQEILAAAEQVFASRGFYATTMEEIARQSEFSVGSLYNFFANKEALYAELKGSIAEAFMAEMEKRVFNMEPAEALGALVDMRMEFLERHRDLLRMVLEESAVGRLNLSRSLPGRCADMFDRYIERLVDIFRRGIRSGVFDDEPPLCQALAFEGMVNALTFYWAVHDGADLSRESVRAAAVNRFVVRRNGVSMRRMKGKTDE